MEIWVALITAAAVVLGHAVAVWNSRADSLEIERLAGSRSNLEPGSKALIAVDAAIERLSEKVLARARREGLSWARVARFLWRGGFVFTLLIALVTPGAMSMSLGKVYAEYPLLFALYAFGLGCMTIGGIADAFASVASSKKAQAARA